MTGDCLNVLNMAASRCKAMRGGMTPIVNRLFDAQLVTQLSDGLFDASVGQLFTCLIITDDKLTSALSVFQDPAETLAEHDKQPPSCFFLSDPGAKLTASFIIVHQLVPAHVQHVSDTLACVNGQFKHQAFTIASNGMVTFNIILVPRQSLLGLVFEFFDAARWVVLNPIQIDALFENDRGNRQDVIGVR